MWYFSQIIPVVVLLVGPELLSVLWVDPVGIPLGSWFRGLTEVGLGADILDILKNEFLGLRGSIGHISGFLIDYTNIFEIDVMNACSAIVAE